MVALEFASSVVLCLSRSRIACSFASSSLNPQGAVRLGPDSRDPSGLRLCTRLFPRLCTLSLQVFPVVVRMITAADDGSWGESVLEVRHSALFLLSSLLKANLRLSREGYIPALTRCAVNSLHDLPRAAACAAMVRALASV